MFVLQTSLVKKNAEEPKDVVKNWMRLKNTIEYMGLWEKLNNPQFKGVGFDLLFQEAGSNAFTLSPTRWIEQTSALSLFLLKLLADTNKINI